MNSCYTALSGCYDRLMTDFNYDEYYKQTAPFIKGCVMEYGIGSGEFTRRYISEVSQVIGVDISEEMLNIAQAKLVKYRRKLRLIADDISSFISPVHVDTLLAVCDTFNYTEDIYAAIKRAATALNDGGHLIFDVSSSYKLREIIGNNVFFEDYDDITYLWTNTLSASSIDMDLTIFRLDSTGKYIRQDDTQRQYIHQYDDIVSAINDDFILLSETGADFLPLKMDNDRWIFICKKR